MAKEYQRYNSNLGRRICDHLSEGKAFKEIAAMRGMPSAKVMAKWLEEDEEGGNKDFKEQFFSGLRKLGQAAWYEWNLLSSSSKKPTINDIKAKYPKLNDNLIKAQLTAELSQIKMRADFLKSITSKISPKVIAELDDKKFGDKNPNNAPGVQINLQYYKDAAPVKLQQGVTVEAKAIDQKNPGNPLPPLTIEDMP